MAFPLRRSIIVGMTTSRNGKKILIVEDDDLMLGVLTQQFLDQGFEVVSAVTGTKAVEKFYSEKPDVVALDIMIPEKDGIKVLDEIHSKTPEDNTPFFILTNSSDMNHIASATNRKVVAYLIKSDQEIQNIVSIIKKHLGIA